jgi:hypothetical protein
MLADTAKQQGLSESILIEKAINNLLSPDSQERREEAFLRKLDKT